MNESKTVEEIRNIERRYAERRKKICENFGIYDIIRADRKVERKLIRTRKDYQKLRETLVDLVYYLTGNPDRITLSKITIRDGRVFKKDNQKVASIEMIIESKEEILEEITHKSYKEKFEETIEKIEKFHKNDYYIIEYLGKGIHQSHFEIEEIDDYTEKINDNECIVYHSGSVSIYGTEGSEKFNTAQGKNRLYLNQIRYRNELSVAFEEKLIEIEKFPYETVKKLIDKAIEEIEEIREKIRCIENEIQDNYSRVIISNKI